ncbi:Eco57I restriction-modification methylase domain-containing protein [Fictibacillus barbaricus]|uniref:site-specific DNA-methyltransferase (adenine-specific) n=1 Tax=Fictibacillus barbaricus TaxID=182136 RepID=A0ABU1U3U6_9BACL|nr:methyltransferase [Fictibacillus barbaricus]MDR7074162.1 type I restriction-modification system DNA methylase subunit [Fictibacillus barbaricus]
MTIQLNGKSMEMEIVKFLKERGLPVVKQGVRMNNKTVDLVGYTVTPDNELVPQVVVEIKLQPTMSAQKQLMSYAEIFQTPYALLITQDRTIWFETDTFLPIENPTFKTEKLFVEDLQEIENTFHVLLNDFRGDMPSRNGWLLILQGLLARSYLLENKSLEQWGEINQNNFFELLEAVYQHYGIDQHVERQLVNERNFQHFIWKLGEIPATHTLYGQLMINLIERNNFYGEYLTSPTVRELFASIINSLNLDSLSILDMGVGYGSIAHSLINSNPNIEKLTAIELNKSTANYFKMLSIISGHKNTHAISGDALESNNSLNTLYDVVVVDPPFGKVQKMKDEYFRYSVTNAGKRKFLETSELFLERATELVLPGGYVVALVTESFLFSETAQITRSLLKERMIVEAIISLPPHTLKPYTGVKVSLLVLRRKTHNQEIADNLFLANCESVEQFPEAVEGYKTWKNGGTLE